MNFLIQVEKGQIVHDFALTLVEQIKDHNYFYPNDLIEYSFAEFMVDEQHFDSIPVGSVEFVSEFFKKYHNITPKPVNIPDSLKKFYNLGRSTWKFDMSTYLKENYDPDFWAKGLFVKSNTKIKDGFQICKDPTTLKVDEYFVSELIDIESEWRGFVFKGELLDIRSYSGNPLVFPDIDKIKYMISKYVDQPVAFTIDIAIKEETRQTVLIEVHDFFSCGLYGFNHPKYPWMLSQWYYEFLRKNLKTGK